MKKRLVATLCSAVLALSSLTSITAQAVQYGDGFIITQEELDAYAESKDTTSTDTSTTTTDTVVTPNWGNFENLHIYGKSFSGTLLACYAVGTSYITNINVNFTATATDLYNDTADGYTVVKVTATSTSNETRYAKNSAGEVFESFSVGDTLGPNSYELIDSLGYQVGPDSRATEYLFSICDADVYGYSMYTWNEAKYFLEPYGYTYEYFKALVTQIYPKNSTGYSNYMNDTKYATVSYNYWLNDYDSFMDNKIHALILSTVEDTYGTDTLNCYISSSGNCVYRMFIDAFTSIYAIPSSEKFYYAFCSSRKLTKEPDSYNATHLITLN